MCRSVLFFLRAAYERIETVFVGGASMIGNKFLYMYRAGLISVCKGGFLFLDIDMGMGCQKKEARVQIAGVDMLGGRSEEESARACSVLRDLLQGKDLIVQALPVDDEAWWWPVDVYARVSEDELWHESVYKFDESGVVLPWLHVNDWLVQEGYASELA